VRDSPDHAARRARHCGSEAQATVDPRRGILEGVTVVALEQAVAAPLATRHLADLGARVIKIERRVSGDFARHYDTAVGGLSSHFVWLNRSKESLTLDIKDRRGMDILMRLLERADVFVMNLAPAAVGRLRLDPARLRVRFPRLIVCAISGYGSSGPYCDKKAYDLLVQAETGLLSITGTDEQPAKAGIAVADIAAGMYAFSGTLAALYAREQDGFGSTVEVSLLDALAEWMGYPLYYTLYGDRPLQRTGAKHATIAPYGTFQTRNGTLLLAIQNDREWVRFCRDVLGRPELADDPRFAANRERVERRDEIERMIDEIFSCLQLDEAIDLLERADLAYAQMRTVAELAEHPQLRARKRWAEVDSPGGTVRTLLPPFSIDDAETQLAPVPRVGEHTAKILHEIGCDEQAIADLVADGVV
jgi:crotonobetainyl-CoA:carnitine CoA-transferase CaiB-like acyl-CoA transferase